MVKVFCAWKFVFIILSSQKAYRVGNCNLEKLTNLCEVIELGRYRARIQTWIFLLPKMISFAQHHVLLTLVFLNRSSQISLSLCLFVSLCLSLSLSHSLSLLLSFSLLVLFKRNAFSPPGTSNNVNLVEIENQLLVGVLDECWGTASEERVRKMNATLASLINCVSLRIPLWYDSPQYSYSIWIIPGFYWEHFLGGKRAWFIW